MNTSSADETTGDFPIKSEIIAGLIQRQLPEWGVGAIVPQILQLQGALREAFLKWWQTDELSDIQVEGVHVNDLIEKHGYTPLAALLTLYSLQLEPDKVKAHLNRGRERFITGAEADLQNGEEANEPTS